MYSYRSYYVLFVFFFQAEDGIRDLTVTGVQTCALPISERTGGSLMALRPPRTIVAFVVAFVCALAVFTLPRFVWNTVQGAVHPQQPAATDSAAPSLAPALAPVPQAAPRSIPQRLTGIFGIALILGIGIALSRNRG